MSPLWEQLEVKVQSDMHIFGSDLAGLENDSSGRRVNIRGNEFLFSHHLATSQTKYSICGTMINLGFSVKGYLLI
jgi:hypothetical protein